MKLKINLIWRIVIAIALGVALGSFVPEWFVRIFATFNSIFGGFLNFAVPLIIIAFIVPGIAKLGKGSGKLLGIATVVAYTSTIAAGILAFFVASNLLPSIIPDNNVEAFENPEEFLASSFISLEILPMMSVLSALLFAFLMGIGIAATGSKTMEKFFDEFNVIIEKLISAVIIPLLPVHILGIFMNMTFGGQVGRILSIFAIVFVMIIVLHWVMLFIQYSGAGAAIGQNPFGLIKKMLPAYFTALGTQSSAATIPVTLRQARTTGGSPKVIDFTVPLYATIHLSGSTITLVSCAIGVMLLNGQAVLFSEFMPFILMLGVTMVAAPGVPGGAVMAAIGILGTMLGFDETMLALMIALYLAQDSFGTATNVTGDGALALIVSRFYKEKEKVSAPSKVSKEAVES